VDWRTDTANSIIGQAKILQFLNYAENLLNITENLFLDPAQLND